MDQTRYDMFITVFFFYWILYLSNEAIAAREGPQKVTKNLPLPFLKGFNCQKALSTTALGHTSNWCSPTGINKLDILKNTGVNKTINGG